MSSAYSIQDFADACGGRLIQEGLSEEVEYLLTDSRKLTFSKGTAFFALETQRNNGHKFISELYQKGVRTFVVSKSDNSVGVKANVILVDDVLKAFQQLAGHQRNKMTYPVLAITGSNGKTIVKEWLFQILHPDYQIVRSPKSFNSQIGVPLSLWNMRTDHDLAIIEAGISVPGEMDKLESIIRPDMGLITNLGEAHSEGFASDEAKLKEKLQLFRQCKRVFYCRDQKIIDDQISKLDVSEIFSWSRDREADLRIHAVNKEIEWTVIKGEYKDQQLEIRIPFTDDASIENAIHCWLISLSLKVDPAALVNRFRKLHSVDIRLNMSRGLQDSVIISDYYNSDPESVRIAINHLVNQKSKGKKIVILSAFEQLRFDPSRYKKVIDLVFQKEVDVLITIGEEWREIAMNDGRIRWYPSTEEFMPFVSELPLRDAVVLLKGARKYRFEEISDVIREKLHTTFLEVNLNALVHNLNFFQERLSHEVKIMAMVKAFSYGSGSVEIANVLQYNHVDYLGVAYLEEGVELRKSGITVPIMVMSPNPNGFDKMMQYRLEPEIYSLDLLKQFIEIVKGLDGEVFPIHIKLDTGMHRLGLNRSDVNLLALILNREKRIVVRSAFSHLAAADDPKERDFSKAQIDRFQEMTRELRSNLGYDFDRHILNSSGIIQMPEDSFDMVRLGIGMYGVDPTNSVQDQLEPVTQLKTHVSQIRKIVKGETVGYGRSFIAEGSMEIAILPIGYADGFFRILSNGRGKVWIKGHLCETVGRVCMDMIMVNVTGLEVHPGDEVEIFGKNLPVYVVAEMAGTIPYELLAHVASRVPRVYSNAQ